MIDNPERVSESPQRIAPSVLAEQTQQIREPAQRDIILRLIKAAELPDMYLHPLRLDLAPRSVVCLQRLFIPHLAIPFGAGINRRGRGFPAIPPLRAPMTDWHRLIAARAVD